MEDVPFISLFGTYITSLVRDFYILFFVYIFIYLPYSVNEKQENKKGRH